MNNLVKIECGRITFSDPCYDLSTWCMIKDIPFPNGIYRACTKEVEENWNGNIITDISELIIYNNEKVPEYSGREMDIWWDELKGEVGVDSGQAGIYDSEYYKNFHSENSINEQWYDEVCNLTIARKFGVKDGECAVSSSGYGDGGYTAYIGKIGNEIVAAKIVFIDEEDDEEEELNYHMEKD